jgi:hypothetical protein
MIEGPGYRQFTSAGRLPGVKAAHLISWVDALEQRSAIDLTNPNWRTDMVAPLFRLARLGDDPEQRLKRARTILGSVQLSGNLTAEQKALAEKIEEALAKLAAAQGEAR